MDGHIVHVGYHVNCRDSIHSKSQLPIDGGFRLLGGGFRENKWISLFSFGYTDVDFVEGRWISWNSLFR